MTYGNSTDLTLLCTSIADSVSSSLKSFGLEIADTWVNSKVEGVSSSPVPDLVEKAATYYAYAFILRNLYDTTDGDAIGLQWFEDTAEKLLESYVAQNATEESEIHPYSGSLSPTNVWTKRDIRTIEDNLDYENQDDNVWEEEK